MITSCSLFEAKGWKDYYLDAIHNYNAENYELALENIELARKYRIPSCSFDTFDENFSILEARIYLAEGYCTRSLELLNNIDGCLLGTHCFERDSLKFEALNGLYGKNNVLKVFLYESQIRKRYLHDQENSYVYLKPYGYDFYFDGKKTQEMLATNNLVGLLRLYNIYAELD